jgi:hypothetical protein
MASIVHGNLDVLIIIVATVIVFMVFGMFEERRITRRRIEGYQTLATTQAAKRDSYNTNWGHEFDSIWPDTKEREA